MRPTADDSRGLTTFRRALVIDEACSIRSLRLGRRAQLLRCRFRVSYAIQKTIRTSSSSELLAVLTPDVFGIIVIVLSTAQQLHRISAYNRVAAEDHEL